MAVTSRERYAVVSCHVERALDDRVWTAFSRLQSRRPAGFAIAALVRPPDASAGEDESLWLERTREAASRGPFGHHTHWTAPDHARPTTGGTGERVLEEGRRLRDLGLAPSAFCGGGWYTDVEVAEACAELGYVDCTPRATRPGYLPAGAAWASLGAPARVRLPSGRRLVVVPTTHSLGELARALAPRRPLPPFVHVYFHDTDLLDRRRGALLRVVLALLARRAKRANLDTFMASIGAEAPEIAWNDVIRL
jgi:hypothetical protein